MIGSKEKQVLKKISFYRRGKIFLPKDFQQMQKNMI